MATALKRTTIFLTPEQHERLRTIAFQRRTSMAKLLRDAAMEILEDEDDVREGLKALHDEAGAISWKEYQQIRRERRNALPIQILQNREKHDSRLCHRPLRHRLKH